MKTFFKNNPGRTVAVLCFAFAVAGLVFLPEVSAEDLLEFVPEEPLLAALFFIVAYALKSLSIFFPLLVLEAAAGYFFPFGTAVLVNLLGLSVTLIIPYFIGRFSKVNLAEKLKEKYPKISEAAEIERENRFFACFFLRAIHLLPGDILSLYFGAVKTPFRLNFIGGLLGLCPMMVLTTFFGSNIREPGSPGFIIAAVMTVTVSVGSALLYAVYKKKKVKK